MRVLTASLTARTAALIMGEYVLIVLSVFLAAIARLSLSGLLELLANGVLWRADIGQVTSGRHRQVAAASAWHRTASSVPDNSSNK
jgi:hypothetical protein